MDVVKEIQEDALLKNVRLFAIMEEFSQYKKTNIISADNFKRSLKKVICSETHRHTGSEVCSNDQIKID